MRFLITISGGILLSNLLIAQDLHLPGVVSTEATESGFCLSPYGKELIFVKSESFYSPSKKSIYYSKQVDDSWTEPMVISFSGNYSDSSPFFTYDGKWIYFSSDRPVAGKNESDKDLWRVAKQDDGSWGKPEHLGFDINSTSSDYSASLDLEGNLYFGSTRNKDAWGNIFFARKNGDKFESPVELPYPINTNDGEWGPCISPNGDFLVFESNGRKENLTYDGDLYIAFKEGDNWVEYKHLPFNSTKSDLSPRIFQDPQGHYHLFFASNRSSGNKDSDDVNIYVVPLKPDKLK